MCSRTSVNGVIGYPAKNRHPAATMASATASDPSRRRLVMPAARRSYASRDLLRRFVLVDLEHEVRADLCARPAPGTAGQQHRVAVALGVDVLLGHDEHVRRAGVDAQVAPLARFDIDDDRAAGERHARTSSHAGARTPAGAASYPVRNACWQPATCCLRYDGSASSTAARARSRLTSDVTAR